MISKNLLKSYAIALYDVAKAEDNLDEVRGDLRFLCELFKRDPEFLKLLSSPMVLKAEKDKLLSESLKGKVQVPSYAFLQVLIKRKALNHLPKIKDQFEHHYNREHGILEGRIYTPFELEEKTLAKVTSIFSKKYNKEVVFRVILDPKVIAGMKIYVDDTLYDYSVDTKLNQVRDRILIG